MVRQAPVEENNKEEVFNADQAVQDLDKVWDYSGVERVQKEIEEQKREPTLMERKMKRIFGGFGNAQKMFLQGFKLGFCVGGIFGGLIGTFYAISSRQFFLMPLSAIGTGCSFGFFMGIGMILRTQMEGDDEETDNKNNTFAIVMLQKNPETGALELTKESIYQKYIV